jgi:hypothetical protein
VPGLLIPAVSSRRVTKTEFDLDKIWRYEAMGYDKNGVFFTETHAYLDHLTNSLATDWVQNHSDAAKNPDSRLPSPEKLYGASFSCRAVSFGPRFQRQSVLGWIDPFRAGPFTLARDQPDPDWSTALDAALTAARRDDLKHGTTPAYGHPLTLILPALRAPKPG